MLKGQQAGLRPVSLRGAVEVDPSEEDFLKRVIEARGQVKADKGRDKRERDAINYFLKILASAGSYGLFVEVNPELVGERQKVKVFSGETQFETSSLVIERPGKWYCPVFGALITAAGRLLLTLLECKVREAGGTYLFCDTDSMAIVASPSGGLVACEGGPDLLPDGRTAIKALTWEELKDIVIYFELLIPYDLQLVRDCLLKVEDVNFYNDVPKQLSGWAIAAKRYVLFRRTINGDIDIRKASAHGLGFLYHPRRKGEREGDVPAWVREAWDWILQGVLNLPRTEPSWFKQPAMMRIAITTPEGLKRL